MRRPKWWNIDWVELGCLGWDIEVGGAGLGEDGEFHWQHAHLDRETLDLILVGRKEFVLRVIGDLKAVGVLPSFEISTAPFTVATTTSDNLLTNIQLVG